MEGIGTLYYSKGGKIRGSFVRGKLHGFGRSEYATGDRYIGMWQNGEFNGKGLFYKRASNRWVLGDFEKGELVREDRNGMGIPSTISMLFSFQEAIKNSNKDE